MRVTDLRSTVLAIGTGWPARGAAARFAPRIGDWQFHAQGKKLAVAAGKEAAARTSRDRWDGQAPHGHGLAGFASRDGQGLTTCARHRMLFFCLCRSLFRSRMLAPSTITAGQSTVGEGSDGHLTQLRYFSARRFFNYVMRCWLYYRWQSWGARRPIAGAMR